MVTDLGGNGIFFLSHPVGVLLAELAKLPAEVDLDLEIKVTLVPEKKFIVMAKGS